MVASAQVTMTVTTNKIVFYGRARGLVHSLPLARMLGDRLPVQKGRSGSAGIEFGQR
jgi:hypothetical protein